MKKTIITALEATGMKDRKKILILIQSEVMIKKAQGSIMLYTVLYE
jgi:hypothetical protein